MDLSRNGCRALGVAVLLHTVPLSRMPGPSPNPHLMSAILVHRGPAVKMAAAQVTTRWPLQRSFQVRLEPKAPQLQFLQIIPVVFYFSFLMSIVSAHVLIPWTWEKISSKGWLGNHKETGLESGWQANRILTARASHQAVPDSDGKSSCQAVKCISQEAPLSTSREKVAERET